MGIVSGALEVVSSAVSGAREAGQAVFDAAGGNSGPGGGGGGGGAFSGASGAGAGGQQRGEPPPDFGDSWWDQFWKAFKGLGESLGKEAIARRMGWRQSLGKGFPGTPRVVSPMVDAIGASTEVTRTGYQISNRKEFMRSLTTRPDDPLASRTQDYEQARAERTEQEVDRVRRQQQGDQ